MSENNLEVKVSYGTRLVELRKIAGLSPEAIAKELHIRRSIIADIEADNIDNIPTVFLRGYIKGYADLVHMPGNELSDYLYQINKKESCPIQMKNYSQNEKQKRHGKRLLAWSIIILVFILGISSFFFWQEYKNEQTSTTHYSSSQRIMQELDNS
ncbi:MAG: helix-turn-helix domain-containing protein [Candidatus Schmidhempelia sp.]|nr:helix-turn-helix domain-containing protein [Candidatus Schmidhempelia sp.]